MHFTAFDLLVNKRQIKKGERRVGVSAICTVCEEERGKGVRVIRSTGTESRGDKLHWQISQPDLTVGDRARVALADFTAVTVLHMPLYIPLYFKYNLPLQTQGHGADFNRRLEDQRQR